jgi:DNA adenine methylase
MIERLMANAEKNRPLLRWAGSKRQLLAPLRAVLPSDLGLYIEPFCGSAALFFDQRPKRAVLADINKELINFYKTCKSNPQELYDLANSIPRTPSAYERVRSKFHQHTNPTARAAYFFYLNRNCFNGLYRTNRSGQFNVPFSASRTGRMHSRDEFFSAVAALKSTRFVACDFERLIRKYSRVNAFFFVDPPYATNAKRPFTEYDSKIFGPGDLVRLLNCLEDVDAGGGRFALTYDVAFSKQLRRRRHWRQMEISVRRNISGFASSRRTAVEVLTTNFE